MVLFSYRSKHNAVVKHAAVFGVPDTGMSPEDHNAHVSRTRKLCWHARGTRNTNRHRYGCRCESGFDFKTLMICLSAHPEWAPLPIKIKCFGTDQHGNWNYYIDNRKPGSSEPGVSETLTDTVTVNSKDGTSHIITVTIHGTNDAPILNAAIE
ncbi:VCBS domain-containing protein [Vibrio lentus]|nr:VCBS domain-containing protein [Vibrio lentus]